MASKLQYSAVDAKVKVLFGRMLTPSDYEELARKNSVAQVASYLKDTPGYGPVLKEMNESTVHRGQLEREIKRALFLDVGRLSRFLKDGAKKYVQEMGMRYEIEFLKETLRHLMYGAEQPFSPDISYDAIASHRLDVERLSRARSYPQFLELLQGTPYHRILARQTEGNLNLFAVETGLDVFYLETMTKLREKYLSGRDLQFERETLGTYTDLSNILAVLRAKTYFQADEQIVYSMIVPNFYRISRQALLQMIRANDVQSALDVLKETRYGPIFQISHGKFYEQGISNYLYRQYRSAVTKGGSIGVVLGYIHLKEMEVSNIIAVVEGIRYSLPPEQTLFYITGYGDTSMGGGIRGDR